jgi:hypothetical protein
MFIGTRGFVENFSATNGTQTPTQNKRTRDDTLTHSQEGLKIRLLKIMLGDVAVVSHLEALRPLSSQ